MRSPKDILNPFVNVIALLATFWVITSCAHVIRPPEAPAPADKVVLTVAVASPRQAGFPVVTRPTTDREGYHGR